MSWCKPKAEYAPYDEPFVPGPKNSNWSHRDPNPVLEADEKAAEDGMTWAWGFDRDITVDEFKKNILSFSFAVPHGCPEPGRDIEVEYMKAPVRDGTKLGLKVYRGKTTVGGGATLVFRMHGGGWVVGCHETEEPENRTLSAMKNVVVVSVDYRMAPEHPFPTAPNDCFDVLKWCKANADRLGINPEKIILVGCSAGANLAAVLAIKAKEEGLTGIIGQHLAIPVTCHPRLFSHVPNHDLYELLSYIQNKDAALVDARRMEVFWDLYTGLNPKADAHHSPLLCSDLGGLPPALIQVAGLDPLRDEGIAYGEALKAAGVEVDTIVYAGLPHGFSGFVGIPESKAYYDKLVAFVRRLIGEV